MTRLAILADIHGNMPALEAVIADLEQFQPDQVIVAGDAINWAPFSAQVLEAIDARRWTVIRGNHEFYLLDLHTPRAPAIWKDRTVYGALHLLQEEISSVWFNRIATWPDQLSLYFPDAPPILVVHGSPRSNREHMMQSTPDEQIRALLQNVPQSIVICAHSHIAMDRQVDGWRLINPGSVGLPLDLIIQASYALLDAVDGEWRATFRRVPYEIAAVEQAFEEQNVIERAGPMTRLALEEFRTAQVYASVFHSWRTTICPEEPITLALAERFIAEVRNPSIAAQIYENTGFPYAQLNANGEDAP